MLPDGSAHDDYVGGLQPGGIHGVTRGQFFVCTVFPAQSLPVTGNSSVLWLMVSGALSVALGNILVRGVRRR